MQRVRRARRKLPYSPKEKPVEPTKNEDATIETVGPYIPFRGDRVAADELTDERLEELVLEDFADLLNRLNSYTTARKAVPKELSRTFDKVHQARNLFAGYRDNAEIVSNIRKSISWRYEEGASLPQEPTSKTEEASDLAFADEVAGRLEGAYATRDDIRRSSVIAIVEGDEDFDVDNFLTFCVVAGVTSDQFRADVETYQKVRRSIEQRAKIASLEEEREKLSPKLGKARTDVANAEQTLDSRRPGRGEPATESFREAEASLKIARDRLVAVEREDSKLVREQRILQSSIKVLGLQEDPSSSLESPKNFGLA